MTTTPPVLLRSDLHETMPERLELLHSGKVRDMYALRTGNTGEAGDDLLLMVASDRVSAFDVVMAEGVPRKGEVLTRTSAYWFARTEDVVPNHMVAVLDAGNADTYGLGGIDPAYFGRSMVVRRTEPLPVECVVRGYVTGSGWAEYQRSGTICGLRLPAGLRSCERLFEPIYTPTTKAAEGHDLPISFEETEGLIGTESANVVKLRSLALYRYGAEVAAERGILIADTKFEFGMLDGEPILIDEALTPDSSRFWPADQYEPGRDQPSFDKQPLRDHLDALDWDKTPPAPALPAEVVSAMSARYQDAFRLITGAPLPPLPA